MNQTAVERERSPVGGVGERELAVLNTQAVDRHRVGTETECEIGRLHLAVGVEAELELRADQTHFGRLPLAAHQRPERELDAERTRADLVLTAADRDVMQRKPRRRQQARVDCAGHAHVEADQPGRLRLERRAISVPIDQQRTDQRRHQRQDDRYRQSKQGRLQRQLQHRSASGPASTPNNMKCTLFMPALGGNYMSQAVASAITTARRSCPDS